VFQISLEQGHSFTTMLAVAVVAIALAGLFYYRTYRMLKPRQWQTLLLLRSAAIVIIVVLLFRPVFSYQRELSDKPALVLLLDSSASMSIADDASGVTRFNQARTQIEKWHDRLKDDFQLELFEFSERARPLGGITELAGLRPEGKATSISRALSAAAEATKQLPRGMLEAVILVSDGVHNSAGDPLEVLPRVGTVHTVGVGASLRTSITYRDIQVTGIDCPDRMLLGNLVKIKGGVEGIGLAGRVIRVFLDEDGRQIAETELTLDDSEGPQEVSFEHRPTTLGRRIYTIRAETLPEEKIAENNQRSAAALVVEPGIRVLYIEGTARAEFGAIVERFLSKDPDLEFYALVQTRPNVFLRRTNMTGVDFQVIPNDAETIDKFDVFIIGDLDSSYIKPAQQELIVKRVRNRGGLLMLGGYRSLGPGGYAGTPIGEALPVVLGDRDVGQITDPFLPTLTPDGARHPIFANIAGFFPTQTDAEPKIPGLPPLDGCTRVLGAKPGATVLATYQAPEGPMPVLAIQPLGEGRAAVFCGDTTRKWHQVPRALDKETPFTRFWGQMVRWLAGRGGPVETGANVTASTDKAAYQPDEPVRITAIVRNQDGQGASGAKVVARIRGPAGRPDQVTLAPAVGPAGHYEGTFEPKTHGTYQIEVEATIGQITVSSEKLVVEAGRTNLEFERLDLNEKLLARIASESRGRYVHISVADNLIDQLDRSQRKRRLVVERQLYWPPVLWTMFVAILTTEWILRKRFQLR